MDEQKMHDLVQDLLPSYIDKLTHESTNETIEKHLASCPTCRAVYENMKSDNEIPKADSRSVDYLLLIKRKTWKKILLSVVGTVLVIGVAALVWVYGIGVPAKPQNLNANVTNTNGKVVIQGTDEKKGQGIGRIRWLHQGDVLKATVYETPNADASFHYAYEQEGITQVWLNGMVEWDDGMAISSSIARLYNMRTKNTSDPLKVKALMTYATALDEDVSYGFENGVLTIQIGQSMEKAELDTISIRLLALIENVKQVDWLVGNEIVQSVRPADVAPDLKDAYAHPAILQRVLENQALVSMRSMAQFDFRWDLDSEPEFVVVTLWQNGKRVYENGGRSMLGMAQIALKDGEYELEIAITQDGQVKKTKPARVDLKENARSFVFEVGQSGGDIEVREVGS